jgi:hypothetical protein
MDNICKRGKGEESGRLTVPASVQDVILIIDIGGALLHHFRGNEQSSRKGINGAAKAALILVK